MEPSPVHTLEKLNVCLTFAQAADGSHKSQVSDEEMQEHYDNFFQEVFVECEVSRSAKSAHLDQCDTGTGVLYHALAALLTRKCLKILPKSNRHQNLDRGYRFFASEKF